MKVWLVLPGSRCAPAFSGSDQLVARARSALRRSRPDIAEAFILEAGDFVARSAPCLNLLGLIAEARGQWGKAKRFWGRSIRADRSYLPPRENLRRWFELTHFGRSAFSVAFGDEVYTVVEPYDRAPC